MALKIKMDDAVATWAYPRCTYKCGLCKNYTVNANKQFVRHSLKHHGKTIAQYKKDVGNPMVNTVFHQCQICNKNIFWERKAITGHVLSTHQMSIDEYYRDFIKGKPAEKDKGVEYQTGQDPESLFQKWLQRDEFECPICKTYSSHRQGN